MFSLNARHVAVVIRGQNADLIDGWLRTTGLERRIALVVPGYIEALHIVARTDLVAFVPGRLIAALAKPLSLTAVTPPLDPGIDEQFMFYPTRAQFDPGSIWLRKLMLETGAGLIGRSGGGLMAILRRSYLVPARQLARLERHQRRTCSRPPERLADLICDRRPAGSHIPQLALALRREFSSRARAPPAKFERWREYSEPGQPAG